MVTVDEWAEIRRLHRVEKLSIKAITRRMGLARNTVREALHSTEPPKYQQRTSVPSKLDPFKERIGELLSEYPDLSAVRVREILQEEGFDGGETIVRAYLRRVRPRPTQAFQRTVYPPGRIGQVDWAQMPDPIPDPVGKPRPVYALVMVLGFSRMLSVSFSFRTRLVDFLRCQAEALAFFGGSPHTMVYDNLRSVVASRRGSEIVFNPQFLPFAERYGFRPWAHWPREPHEKGAVERPVRYLKGNFWAGRRFRDLDDLQVQANAWRDSVANVRRHRGLDERPVDRFAQEQPALLPLPEEPFEPEEIIFARVSRWGYVRLDANDYSVPLLLAGARLGARLSATEIRIFHQGMPIASHPRCFGRHQIITRPEHQNRPWAVHHTATRPKAVQPVPGLELPHEATLAVQQRDLAVYDALLQEERP